ncbi:MAG TPA: Holliday junction resolvase RuvX [Pyrinomonadaceae bacterium]|nr:Holliday junction resolvase RuvX [Pyrinomonadaceae bacterium]
MSDLKGSQNHPNNLVTPVAGPVLALDLGQKLVGVAVSDELLITARRLDPLRRSNWKQLLRDVQTLLQSYDAQTLVIGLPLNLNGTEGEAAEGVQRLAENFARSLTVPVYLQDERLTSFAARQTLLAEGVTAQEIPALIDGEAAATILRDFLTNLENRVPVFP